MPVIDPVGVGISAAVNATKFVSTEALLPTRRTVVAMLSWKGSASHSPVVGRNAASTESHTITQRFSRLVNVTHQERQQFLLMLLACFLPCFQ